MKNSFSPVLWIISILAALTVFSSCRTKPVAVTLPAVNVDEIVAQGDAAFERQHLLGWRQAESFYKKAFQLEASNSIRDKLLLTRFLIVTRNIEEDICDPAMESALGEMCSTTLTARQKILYDLAIRHKTGSAAQPFAKDPAYQNPFDAENSALDAYLHTLYAQTYGIKESNETVTARAEKFKDSPLFIYLDLGKRTAQRAEELEKVFPDFAELRDFMGGVQFQRGHYSTARAYFKKAIELIPEYTRSLNGLGNIALFALEDFEQALGYYQSSLKLNPDNPAALYGTALVSHNLGRYAESNANLDRMLQSDLARGGHTSKEAVNYYRGEANYYKAYNFHLLGEPEKAREFVEVAKGLLPRSDHVYYLSGLLYYQNRQIRPARDEFMRVLQNGASNCDAQYYLGRIYRESTEDLDEQPPELTSGVKVPERLAEYLKQVPLRKETKGRRSLDYFLAACSCMDSDVRSMENQIKSVPAMDLDAAEKAALQGKLTQKLLASRRSSASVIDVMLDLASSSELGIKSSYLNLMKEVRERILQVDRQRAAPPQDRH